MSKEQSLYERIGGAAAVDQLVDDFYGRVLADAELRPFFRDASVDQLKRMQKEFFAAALDWPVITSDIDLAGIHQGLGITRKYLTRFVNHLIAELDERSQIKPRDAMSIIYHIGTYSDQIVDGASGTDG
jgi:hemoglobin